jgi:hypothetical protein
MQSTLLLSNFFHTIVFKKQQGMTFHDFPRSGFRFNTGLAKVAVQCYADTFVVNQSLVLRINICGENRHLRQARKRYATFLK